MAHSVTTAYTTIDINDNNFSDYFECVKIQLHNSFGEPDNQMIGFGLKSKAYDDGLILYDVTGVNVELMLADSPTDYDLASLLSCGCSYGGGYTIDELPISFSRTTGGTVTFIKSEYVDSYELEDFKETRPDYKNAVITLKNGETLSRLTQPDYLY